MPLQVLQRLYMLQWPVFPLVCELVVLDPLLGRFDGLLFLLSCLVLRLQPLRLSCTDSRAVCSAFALDPISCEARSIPKSQSASAVHDVAAQNRSTVRQPEVVFRIEQKLIVHERPISLEGGARSDAIRPLVDT